MQPSVIIIQAKHDALLGNWNVHRNHQALWTSPLIGWLKVNFDGSVQDSYWAGLGCVARDHRGDLLAAKGIKCHSRLVDMTESRGAFAGLAVVRSFFISVTGIILEGDSTSACDRANRILSGAYSGDTEASFAKVIMEAPRVVISLIDREANTVADFVAKFACDNELDWGSGMPLSQNLFRIIST
ncbi:hypothetical protein KSP39_PZI016379 [Platanthera zijinensis]|uniref:RNase H type-1 domain-containing protein n=1 Tax=Platanthera zijinensis TaxID=2320716 RepID=A0AAP0B6N7_9ASPA